MLKTNHRSLLYLNALPSGKVLREELAIQEYDFDVLQIAEVKNVVADSFSRLVEATRFRSLMFSHFAKTKAAIKVRIMFKKISVYLMKHMTLFPGFTIHWTPWDRCN